MLVKCGVKNILILKKSEPYILQKTCRHLLMMMTITAAAAAAAIACLH